MHDWKIKIFEGQNMACLNIETSKFSFRKQHLTQKFIQPPVDLSITLNYFKYESQKLQTLKKKSIRHKFD